MKEKKNEKLYKMKNGVAARNEEKDGDGDAERQGE